MYDGRWYREWPRLWSARGVLAAALTSSVLDEEGWAVAASCSVQPGVYHPKLDPT